MLCLGLLVPAMIFGQEDEDVSPYREMKTLARAVELIRQDYVDEGKTDYEELVYSALRGMLEELDPHSDFMDPKDFKGMQEDTRSEFGGLGVVVGMKNERLTIVAPMEGTPGFRAGLRHAAVALEFPWRRVDGCLTFRSCRRTSFPWSGPREPPSRPTSASWP